MAHSSLSVPVLNPHPLNLTVHNPPTPSWTSPAQQSSAVSTSPARARIADYLDPEGQESTITPTVPARYPRGDPGERSPYGSLTHSGFRPGQSGRSGQAGQPVSRHS